MTTVRIASLQTEWTAHQYLARYLLRRRLRREETLAEAFEETLAEATAHAWQAFTKIRQGRPEKTVRRATWIRNIASFPSTAGAFAD